MALLDKVLKAAVDLKASDLHVLPNEPFMVYFPRSPLWSAVWAR